jgi:hypothetical protein
MTNQPVAQSMNIKKSALSTGIYFDKNLLLEENVSITEKAESSAERFCLNLFFVIPGHDPETKS